MNSIRQCITRLTFNQPLNQSSRSHHLRGAIGNLLRNNFLFHQHDSDGKPVYRYPLIQYKIFDQTGVIVGLAKGAESLGELKLLGSTLVMGNSSYEVVQQQTSYSIVDVGYSPNLFQYEFMTPWIALNEKNFEKYQKIGDQLRRKYLLSKILTGNLLSMSKGIGYSAENTIYSEIYHFEEANTSLKGNPMVGFLARFETNFVIPDFWGLGKSVSRGFGVVLSCY
jgi:hypothetical protein